MPTLKKIITRIESDVSSLFFDGKPIVRKKPFMIYSFAVAVYLCYWLSSIARLINRKDK